ncbi:MAG: NAD/NADP octopine/nopaline dehydrogenase family protein [Candidatus Obscuribacterales bacterium]|nr:NAD/NADP octopine/nopaline dehydrogenase family protein [Candidatus Obscuribacterales bacterium]
MNNLAVAVEGFSSALDIAFVSSGLESLACASWLAAAGQRVQLRGNDRHRPASICYERNDADHTHAQPVQFLPPAREADGYVRSPDIIVLHARASDYKRALDTVAAEVLPGQTIFIIDAPLMTAFELSERLHAQHQRAAVNIIETGPLFNACKMTGATMHITGAATQVPICGRTVNETRAGLSIGRAFWKNLVPASNVFERRLVHSARILGAAQRLFAIMGTRKGQDSLTGAEQSILTAMTNELQSLGKHLNVSIPKDQSFEPMSESLAVEREELATVVREDLILITELAKLAYVPVPTIDSIIELATVTLGQDLRKESRSLADLGLIGMDFHEIIELVNA